MSARFKSAIFGMALFVPYLFFGILMILFAAWMTVIVLPLYLLYLLFSLNKEEELKRGGKSFRYIWLLGPYHIARPIALSCFGCSGKWMALPSCFEPVKDTAEEGGAQDRQTDWGWHKIRFIGGISGGNPGGHPPEDQASCRCW
eukprot:TRINITY_DN8949_c0_g1_i1.p1 TRINITY_DN8949_c0_g1~~TRINITY_DN8949_c0_g1_i1.p1  ORF type:complete len:144 (-),score=19.20 TRINITY_DN8949_c0_g1_i1:138-569(-)